MRLCFFKAQMIGRFHNFVSFNDRISTKQIVASILNEIDYYNNQQEINYWFCPLD